MNEVYSNTEIDKVKRKLAKSGISKIPLTHINRIFEECNEEYETKIGGLAGVYMLGYLRGLEESMNK
jgi:hypothetical protein